MADLINLSNLVQDVVLSYIARNSNVKANFDIENNVQVTGDRKLLQGAIDKIIGNAISRSSGNEIPLVTFAKVPNEDKYFIRDNGDFDSALTSKNFNEPESSPGNKLCEPLNELIKAGQLILKQGGKIWGESIESVGTTIYFTMG